MSRSLEHLCELASRGRHPAASGGEKQARKIVNCILANAIGLDGAASAGITELIRLVQAQPIAGRDAVKKAASIR